MLSAIYVKPIINKLILYKTLSHKNSIEQSCYKVSLRQKDNIDIGSGWYYVRLFG